MTLVPLKERILTGRRKYYIIQRQSEKLDIDLEDCKNYFIPSAKAA